MLIRTRKLGQTLKIGDEIEVTLISLKGNQVRLGVNAPKDVPVHREELYKRIQLQEVGQDAMQGQSFACLAQALKNSNFIGAGRDCSATPVQPSFATHSSTIASLAARRWCEL